MATDIDDLAAELEQYLLAHECPECNAKVGEPCTGVKAKNFHYGRSSNHSWRRVCQRCDVTHAEYEANRPSATGGSDGS